MEAEPRSNPVVFKVFDGKNFREWKEMMMLFLMGLGLWITVEGFELLSKDEIESTAFELKKQKAFAIISLNLSSSCRDCIRNSPDKNPASAWALILAKYEGKTPLDKLMALDELLAFILNPNDIAGSISQFKEIIAHIRSLGITLDEHLFIALLLRRLPSKFAPLATNLRHREEIDLDTAIQAVEQESRALDDPSDAKTSSSASVEALMTTSFRCTHCNKTNHNVDQCWILHPELKPTCGVCGVSGHKDRACRSNERKQRKSAQQYCSIAEVDAFAL